ncbi:MAG: YcgL domain-containing protein [Motiliproteus sp.]|nr:YcgL domain-containing protein [Motiliproteus sp.]MCW9053340.1 YcgL domain-containing protein [Motiliproteus sp.]
MKRICSVFKSPKKDEMYLYVDKREGLERVPEALLSSFGEPKEVMTLLVAPGKKLARVEAEKVLADILKQGFYLQMPPAREEYMLDLYKTPTEGKY